MRGRAKEEGKIPKILKKTQNNENQQKNKTENARRNRKSQYLKE